jgi:hypothetical protein
MSADRAAKFWQQAEYATSRADQARSDELRRAWLIVARDWANMARHEETKAALQELAYVANVPTAPEVSSLLPSDAEHYSADPEPAH